MIRVKKELYLMEIDGVESVVLRIFTPQGSRWFSPGKKEYTSPSELAQIKAQFDEEHRFGIADLYDMIQGISTDSFVSNEAFEEEKTVRGEADTALDGKIESLKESVEGISVPTKVSELENDNQYTTAKEVAEALSAIEIPDKLPNPEALTIKYNGVEAFSYDGSVAETGNFIVNANTVPMSEEDPTSIAEKINSIQPEEVPTKVSELENDSEYQTKEDLDKALDDKVSWTDINTEENHGRRAIVLPNHDNILGTTSEGETVNVAMVSKWNKTDLGSSKIEINLNGSADRPTYNDEKKLALLDDIPEVPDTSNFVDEKIESGNGAAYVWNEASGGGARFEHKDGTKSFVGVSDGGEDGMTAQIYSHNSDDSKCTRFNVYNKGVFYHSPSESGYKSEDDPDREIAVKGDIPNVEGMATSEEVDALRKAVEAVSVPTKISELENDSDFVTSENISDAVEKGVDEAVESFKVYNLGNFETLDAVNLRLADHNYYNNTNRVIYHFTVANTDMGLVINNMGEMVGGYPYVARQYMYYQEHRYTRTVRRNSVSGLVTYTSWVIEDFVTLSGKGIDFLKLSSLTTEASDSEVQEALTYLNGDGVVTVDDLRACFEKGMFLKEYSTSTQLIVGQLTNYRYSITYIGYPISAYGMLDTTRAPKVQTVFVRIQDGVYSIDRAANTDDVLTTGWDKYPLEVKIPLWGTLSGDTVYSENTILGWFGCSSVGELKAKAKDTSLMSMLYLNSGDMYYRIPVQFIEFKNGNNQIHIVTVGVDMMDDSPCRYEITINIDGTIVSGNSNVSLVKEALVKASAIEELKELVSRLQERIAALEGGSE